MRKKQKNATLKTIAEECGVSTMTASRAFKDSSLVDPRTRAVILKTAAQSGYQPDGRMGRPRRPTDNTRHIAQVIINMNINGGTSLFHAYLLGAMERALAQRAYDCLLRTYDGSYDNFVRLCETLRATTACPTMIVGDFPLDHLHTLLTLCPTALLVDCAENPRLACPYSSIGFENGEAARMAARHLCEMGRRRILLLKGHSTHFFSREIERGYRDFSQINNLPVDEALIISADFTAQGACRAVTHAINRGLKFDAVFTNDEMALGVMKSLREHGKKIPGDVAVCGCDGLPFDLFLTPPLSTIILDYDELGKAAVEKISSLRKGPLPAVRIRLVPRLEARESTLDPKTS